MISILFRDAVALLPLIGPHGDREADLLLFGSKPVGLFCEVIPAEPSQGFHDAHAEKIRSDIVRLDFAVEDGKLSKCEFYLWDKEKNCRFEWNFFCKKGKENEMFQVREEIVAAWENREPGFHSSKKHGEILGYSIIDVWLFERGGYDSLPFPFGMILQSTHDFRLKCRINRDMEIHIADFSLD